MWFDVSKVSITLDSGSVTKFYGGQAGPDRLRPIGLDYKNGVRADDPVRDPKISGGCSSVGRAPDLHSGGRRFDPDQLHQLATQSSVYN